MFRLHVRRRCPSPATCMPGEVEERLPPTASAPISLLLEAPEAASAEAEANLSASEAGGAPLMSVLAARRFHLRMKTDCEFFYRVVAIEDPEERQAFIRRAGYDCTHREIVDTLWVREDVLGGPG